MEINRQGPKDASFMVFSMLLECLGLGSIGFHESLYSIPEGTGPPSGSVALLANTTFINSKSVTNIAFSKGVGSTTMTNLAGGCAEANPLDQRRCRPKKPGKYKALIYGTGSNGIQHNVPVTIIVK